MGKLLNNFLKAYKGKCIFVAFRPASDGGKYGCEGILEDYDKTHLFLRGEEGVMVISRDFIMSYELSYKNMKVIEIVKEA